MQHNRPVTHLPEIAALAVEREAENEAFRSFLRQQDAHTIDRQVQQLNEEITPAIDCTQCGNCCRSLMIQVNPDEAEPAATALGISVGQFNEQYLERSSGGQLLINRIPCHFLEGNRCGIYESRFSSCREFPPLHLPGFTHRLFALMFHYGSCPIVFNVMEALKTSTGFRHNT